MPPFRSSTAPNLPSIETGAEVVIAEEESENAEPGTEFGGDEMNDQSGLEEFDQEAEHDASLGGNTAENVEPGWEISSEGGMFVTPDPNDPYRDSYIPSRQARVLSDDDSADDPIPYSSEDLIPSPPEAPNSQSDVSSFTLDQAPQQLASDVQITDPRSLSREDPMDRSLEAATSNAQAASRENYISPQSQDRLLFGTETGVRSIREIFLSQDAEPTPGNLEYDGLIHPRHPKIIRRMQAFLENQSSVENEDSRNTLPVENEAVFGNASQTAGSRAPNDDGTASIRGQTTIGAAVAGNPTESQTTFDANGEQGSFLGSEDAATILVDRPYASLHKTSLPTTIENTEFLSGLCAEFESSATLLLRTNEYGYFFIPENSAHEGKKLKRWVSWVRTKPVPASNGETCSLRTMMLNSVDGIQNSSVVSTSPRSRQQGKRQSEMSLSDEHPTKRSKK